MSIPAWSALAARFQDLSQGLDFALWFYNQAVIHPPPGVARDAIRNFSATRATEVATVYASHLLQGTSPLTPDEFKAFNRFHWLAWTAGLALDPLDPRPDVAWLIHLYRARPAAFVQGDHYLKLARVAEASALVAADLSNSPRPARSAAGESDPADWRTPLLTLRSQFERWANGNPWIDMELSAFSTQDGFFRHQEWYQRNCDHSNRLGRLASLRMGTGPAVVGEQAAMQAFMGLAEQAGRWLPTTLRAPLRLLPLCAPVMAGDHEPVPLVAWLEFLWAANPNNFQPCGDNKDPGARIAAWKGGNPFLASVLALDRFITAYGPSVVQTFQRQLVEVCPWLTPADADAAKLAVAFGWAADLGAKTVSRSTPDDHDPPESPEPPAGQIERAERDLPDSLAEMTSECPDAPEGEIVVRQSRLVQRLGEMGHRKPAAEWAIHRLIQGGLLTAHRGHGAAPSVIAGDGIRYGGGVSYSDDPADRHIGSTAELWALWRARGEQAAGASEAVASQGSDSPAVAQAEPKKRGRGKPKVLSQDDYELVQRWEKAKAQGVTLKEFESRPGERKGSVEAAQARIRVNRNRADKRT